MFDIETDYYYYYYLMTVFQAWGMKLVPRHRNFFN